MIFYIYLNKNYIYVIENLFMLRYFSVEYVKYYKYLCNLFFW